MFKLLYSFSLLVQAITDSYSCSGYWLLEKTWCNMPGFSAGKQQCAVSLSFQSLIRTKLTKVTVRQKPRFNVTKSHTCQSQFALPGCCGEVYHLATVLQHENTPHKNDRASGRLSQKLLLNCLTKAKCRKLLRCDIPQLQVLCLPEILPGS